MTVTAAPPRRAVIDLGAEATILDAAARLSEVDSPDVVFVVPAGAPLARNAVFLDVLRRRAGDRRIVLVSSDARARSLAAAVHLRSFSSLSALDRHELDATEHLSDVRRKALTKVAAPGGRRGISVGRRLAVFTSLLTAALILLAVVGPTATIVITATPAPLGPFEYDLRAGPQGDIRATTLIDDKVTATITGTATDSRDARVRATGFEKFTNMTTNDIRIPAGTIVQTTDNPPIRFQTTQEKVLPRSTLLPVLISTVTIGIEALEVGTRGNVAADKITQDSSPDYMVTNPAATSGGEDKRIPVVKLSDYETAVAAADRDSKVTLAAENRVKDWKAKAPKGMTVYGYTWLRTGATPASEVVGHEGQETFEITVTGTVTAYQVAENEPSATALDRLKGEVPSGMELALNSAIADPPVIGPGVASDGVHWRIRARGQIVPRPNTGQMTAALAGRSFDEIKPILTDRLGFQVQSYDRWPEWWPRLPVLDSRIKIEIASATSASPP